MSRRGRRLLLLVALGANGCFSGLDDQLLIGSSGYQQMIHYGSGLCVLGSNGGTAVGDLLEQNTCNATAAVQQWQLIATDSGYVKLVNRAAGLVVEVQGAATTGNAKVQLQTFTGAANQQWMPMPAAKAGATNFIARHDAYCLDVINGSNNAGTQLQQHDCNASNAQTFQLVRVP